MLAQGFMCVIVLEFHVYDCTRFCVQLLTVFVYMMIVHVCGCTSFWHVLIQGVCLHGCSEVLCTWLNSDLCVWFLSRAANHYTSGVIYYTQIDCIMLLCPWRNYCAQNIYKRGVKWSFLCLLEWKNPSATCVFFMLCRWQCAFVFLKKQANRSAWFISYA